MKHTLSILALALAVTATAQGYDCYEAPLRPCRWSFTEWGGVDPTYLTYRQNNEFDCIVAAFEAYILSVSNVNQEGEPITPTVTVLETSNRLIIQKDNTRAPKFSDQFDLPWLVGGELAYSVNCNTELFIDGSYSKAEGKKDSYHVSFDPIEGAFDEEIIIKPGERIYIREKYSDLESYTGNLGFRYYFPKCWCNCVSLFFGAKVGFKHWDNVNAKVHLTIRAENEETEFVDLGKYTYYPAVTAINAGFQLGLIFCLSDCFSIVLSGEAIGTGSFKFGNDIEAPRGEIYSFEETNDIGLTGIRSTSETIVVPVRRSGTIVSFPVRLGIRYTF